MKQNANLFEAKLGYHVACYLDDKDDSALLSVLSTINNISTPVTNKSVGIQV